MREETFEKRLIMKQKVISHRIIANGRRNINPMLRAKQKMRRYVLSFQLPVLEESRHHPLISQRLSSMYLLCWGVFFFFFFWRGGGAASVLMVKSKRGQMDNKVQVYVYPPKILLSHSLSMKPLKRPQETRKEEIRLRWKNFPPLQWQKSDFSMILLPLKCHTVGNTIIFYGRLYEHWN